MANPKVAVPFAFFLQGGAHDCRNKKKAGSRQRSDESFGAIGGVILHGPSWQSEVLLWMVANSCISPPNKPNRMYHQWMMSVRINRQSCNFC